jgi:2-amino-4-hydroxy-6-hydroxymethyldihydropteridine diphosphokinase
MRRCFIGLGSNLDEPLAQLQHALTALDALEHCQLGRVSPFYSNPAVGPGIQPDYVNAVAELFTTLDAHALLARLQAIESARGRVRNERWGARTLDLDLLLYDAETIASDTLQVPHPRIRERNFVLYPLYDIAPDLRFPDGTPLKALLDCCPDAGLHRL